jgi:protocatechuate 3,4-dioxygenase beta subunit
VLLPGRVLAGECLPDCVVRPAQTAGPYFTDAALERSDIRSDPHDGAIALGMPLALTMLVSRLADGECRPLPGAEVHLWHCDAQGVYSGVRDPRFDTRDRAFLRGYQITDDCGEARFLTIFPGWYPGRAVHLHFKILARSGDRRSHEFTSQLYFDDALTDRVHAHPPYAARGQRNRRNAGDGIFRRGGAELMLAPVESDDGLAARFAVGLHMV